MGNNQDTQESPECRVQCGHLVEGDGGDGGLRKELLPGPNWDQKRPAGNLPACFCSPGNHLMLQGQNLPKSMLYILS